jgi:putative FmdB family regulatory protein
MPSYDYRCTNCENLFEAVHAIQAPRPTCPMCGGDTKRLIISTPAMHGFMARGRELAARSLPECGKGCRCCP